MSHRKTHALRPGADPVAYAQPWCHTKPAGARIVAFDAATCKLCRQLLAKSTTGG